jgi:hypothetical protein
MKASEALTNCSGTKTHNGWTGGISHGARRASPSLSSDCQLTAYSEMELARRHGNKRSHHQRRELNLATCRAVFVPQNTCAWQAKSSGQWVVGSWQKNNFSDDYLLLTAYCQPPTAFLLVERARYLRARSLAVSAKITVSAQRGTNAARRIHAQTRNRAPKICSYCAR